MAKARQPDWPEARWLTDLPALLPVCSQFVLSGNIHDQYLLATETQADGRPATIVNRDLIRALWAKLEVLGYELIVRYDTVAGARVYPDTAAVRERAAQLDIVRDAKGDLLDLVSFQRLLERLTRSPLSIKSGECVRVAIVVEHASRIGLQQGAGPFLAASRKHALEAWPGKQGESAILFNPVIWLLDSEEDFPSWFVTGTGRIHEMPIPLPDYDKRLAMAHLVLKRGKFIGTQPAMDEKFAKLFADSADTMTLRAMDDIGALALTRGYRVEQIEDAVRSYRSGDQSIDSPWQSQSVREKIRNAERTIPMRVLGQDLAIGKCLDILKRSVLGLNGAQAPSSRNRPRGVLFFAGPTGVGKTELAKALARTLFGNDEAMIRFDMSEYSAEHAEARLIGAPPGYTGYEGGGQLTTAIRARPFSVILFDEIEKAHPRIFDKFLQILEDGRITDGRGETVFFSEAVIVFTSNLGIVERERVGDRIVTRPVVKWGADYVDLKQRVLDGIKKFFESELTRPELLNRLGDNIVVFDFIRNEVADKILTLMLGFVGERVHDELEATIVFDEIKTALAKECLAEETLANGGRGIGNRLETVLINPLARAMFDLTEPVAGKTVAVRRVEKDAETGLFNVELHINAAAV